LLWGNAKGRVIEFSIRSFYHSNINPPSPSSTHPLAANSQHQTLRNKDNKSGEEAIVAVKKAASNVLDKLMVSGVDDQSKPSNDELQLEWVHGYRGYDFRNNVFHFESNKRAYVVYYAAALGIMLQYGETGTDKKSPFKPKQSYFRGHTDDITAMACYTTSTDEIKNSDNDGAAKTMLVATGQIATGSVYIWAVPSLETLRVINTKQKSITHLAFSSDGRFIISMTGLEDKGGKGSVVVTDWRADTEMANTQGESSEILHMATGLKQTGDICFLSVGDKHLGMWTLRGKNLGGSKKISMMTVCAHCVCVCPFVLYVCSCVLLDYQ
jgi:WD40 repeat protein